jgi:microcin C transport system substrate-binding protein
MWPACRFFRSRITTKPFEESTLDIPLGSGPYKVGRFEAGRYIEYERVKDWWAKDLPVSRGAFNFDTVRYEFYRDRDVAFEGFTGRNYLIARNSQRASGIRVTISRRSRMAA